MRLALLPFQIPVESSAQAGKDLAERTAYVGLGQFAAGKRLYHLLHVFCVALFAMGNVVRNGG